MKPILSLLAIVLLGVNLPGVVQAQKSDDPLMSAIAEMQAGNTDKAIAALTEVIKLQPNNGDAYFLRSTLRVTSEDTAGALSERFVCLSACEAGISPARDSGRQRNC